MPLVLIHGVGTDHESWNWVIKRLNGYYRILTMDLRGHGLSSRTREAYTLEMFADDVMALCRRIGFSCFYLVGFSLGGLIAQKMAIKYPDSLFGLVIISSVTGRTDEEKQKVKIRLDALTSGGMDNHSKDAMKRWFTDEFIQNYPDTLKWRNIKSANNDPHCYAAAYRVLAESDLVEELFSITVPTLAITGEQDIGSTPRMSELLANRVQNGSAIILPGLKHSVLLEAPDVIANCLDEFMAELNDNQLPGET